MNNLDKLLIKGAKEFSLNLDDKQVKKFFIYMKLLKEWNQSINLTAVREEREIIIKHFLDSLSIAPFTGKNGNKLVDIGTGAGFPGIPLKIMRDEVKILLVDSTLKKLSFVDEVINELELKNINTVHIRAEDMGRDKAYREAFDTVCARAVAGFPVLLEYCLPLLKKGGRFIAMKGRNTSEVDNSEKALEVLGGKVTEIKKLNIPFSGDKRNIIITKKFRHTPTKYPRKAGKPSKKPLR